MRIYQRIFKVIFYCLSLVYKNIHTNLSIHNNKDAHTHISTRSNTRGFCLLFASKYQQLWATNKPSKYQMNSQMNVRFLYAFILILQLALLTANTKYTEKCARLYNDFLLI
jgi:hypothetical protein